MGSLLRPPQSNNNKWQSVSRHPLLKKLSHGLCAACPKLQPIDGSIAVASKAAFGNCRGAFCMAVGVNMGGGRSYSCKSPEEML